MESTPLTNRQPRPHDNGYRAEDIEAEYGTLADFMAAIGPKSPLDIPDLGFTEAENQHMDQLLAEEHDATDTI